jgi:hypothetical protein
MRGATKLMEELKTRFPADLDYVTSLDTTLAVSAGMHEILKTLVEALLLVIIVVFVFLQGFRATLIPTLAVPVSLVARSWPSRSSASPSIRCRCSASCSPSGSWWMTPSLLWRPSSTTSRRGCPRATPP